MKQVIHRKLSKTILRLGLIILLALTTSLSAQEGDPAKGKSLFNSNCAACHQLDKNMTGPALRNFEARLANDQGLDRQWIDSWIRNSTSLIKSGDAYANKIFNEYNKLTMTPFPQLSDQDISDIIAFTAEERAVPPAADAAATGGAGATSGS